MLRFFGAGNKYMGKTAYEAIYEKYNSETKKFIEKKFAYSLMRLTEMLNVLYDDLTKEDGKKYEFTFDDLHESVKLSVCIGEEKFSPKGLEYTYDKYKHLIIGDPIYNGGKVHILLNDDEIIVSKFMITNEDWKYVRLELKPEKYKFESTYDEYDYMLFILTYILDLVYDFKSVDYFE